VMILKFYRKTSANMAFVRTGRGGVKVIRDGGAYVLPVIHHVTPVSLERVLNFWADPAVQAGWQGSLTPAT
jgi:uncharacterized membrane protein YqiK